MSEWCMGPHSKHRFPAPSSKHCKIWLRHWREILYLHTAVHRHGQRPSKGLGTDHTPCIAFRHLLPRKDVVNQCLEFVLGVMYKIYNGLVQCPNIKTKLVPPPAQITAGRESNTEPGIAKPVALVHHSNRIGDISRQSSPGISPKDCFKYVKFWRVDNFSYDLTAR